MQTEKHLNLLPPLVESGDVDSLASAGQVLSSTWSPLNATLAISLTSAVCRICNSCGEQDSRRSSSESIDLSTWDFRWTAGLFCEPGHGTISREASCTWFYPHPLICYLMNSVQFITDTLVIFSAFQKVIETSKEHNPEWCAWRSLNRSFLTLMRSGRLLRDENVNVFRKLAIDYVNFIRECWIHSSVRPQHNDLALNLTHNSNQWSALTGHRNSVVTIIEVCTPVSLCSSCYTLPSLATRTRPSGTILWNGSTQISLNLQQKKAIFWAPLIALGKMRTFGPTSRGKPWHKTWNSRKAIISFRATLRGLSKASLFFLEVLSKHSSEDLRSLSKSLAPLIETQPRLQHYSSERDFAYASRRWSDRVKALRIEMERVPEDERFDGFDNWWDRLSDVVGILEGRAEVIMRICKELGSDWKEVCAAWGVFVNVRLRRQDLPCVF